MSKSPGPATRLRRRDARWIWQAGVAAVQPEQCLASALDKTLPPLDKFDRLLVVGGGKAGAGMSRVLEAALERRGIDFGRVVGHVNVPNELVQPLRAIKLHASRPMGTNQPTEEAMHGAIAILDIAAQAGPNDLLICLLSGGGSALLPAPVEGISLADKQQTTALLHHCGATIQEMNAVRKHLSRIKGGGLARHFKGKRILNYVISDVVGDPLDVIASGPTCVDPTTYADALNILERYDLLKGKAHVMRVPPPVLSHLLKGAAGQVPETMKEVPRDDQKRPLVQNIVVANNQIALDAAAKRAEALGYEVWNFGAHVEGESRNVAKMMAFIVTGLAENRKKALKSRKKATPTKAASFSPLSPRIGGRGAGGEGGRTPATVLTPLTPNPSPPEAGGEGNQIISKLGGPPPTHIDPPPLCIIIGGETTVALTEDAGLGGRNQEFVLAFIRKMSRRTMAGITVLSGGTDGEDGPTDAAGAFGDADLVADAEDRKLSKTDFLARHDSYHFFEPLGGLLKTGLTQTNVMDVRVILINPPD